jgi:AcrR family transcriptional regulator
MNEQSVKERHLSVARPLSEEKRNALLKAAADAIAAEGVGVSTSRIAKEAGVATGSLFLYFPTKDDLLNQLYSTIKQEIAEAMLARYPQGAAVSDRMRSVWTAYLKWGVANPSKRQAMSQLSVSHRITREVRDESMGLLREVETLLKECLGPRSSMSVAFAVGIMTALTEVTIGFMASDKKKATKYAEVGFAALMKALS